jgi:hypothetical protein
MHVNIVCTLSWWTFICACVSWNHVCLHDHAHAYVHVCHEFLHICMSLDRMHAYIHTCIHTYIHKRIQGMAYTKSRTANTYTYTYISTYTYPGHGLRKVSPRLQIHTHIHTYLHTRIQGMAYAKHILQGHAAAVLAVAFSPDCTMLASASCDSTVVLWDVETGEVLHVLEGHVDFVRYVHMCVCVCVCNCCVFVCTIRMWELAKSCMFWRAMSILLGIHTYHTYIPYIHTYTDA